jgi:hypothetical protein
MQDQADRLADAVAVFKLSSTQNVQPLWQQSPGAGGCGGSGFGSSTP